MTNAGSANDDRSPYDVFVSYRHVEPQCSWVRKTLVPALRASGIRIFIDYEDFYIGRPLVLEMARAIEQSRFTLAVLSPAYLDSTFTDLENVLAEHVGLETAANRLLLVMREPCVPRLGLRARLWLDLTDDAEVTAGCLRLAREVKAETGG